jgi:hypothetical protein
MASKRNKDKRVQVAGVESLITALKKELEGEAAPEGWYTVAQIGNMLGINFQATIRLAVRKKWECKRFTAITADNRKLLIKHYLIK